VGDGLDGRGELEVAMREAEHEAREALAVHAERDLVQEGLDLALVGNGKEVVHRGGAESMLLSRAIPETSLRPAVAVPRDVVTVQPSIRPRALRKEALL
jgi:hypothetical protein